MRTRLITPLVALLLLGARTPDVAKSRHDLLIRGGAIYDGSGSAPFIGDVVIDGNRISYVGPHRPTDAKRVIDAAGKAVSPGFINMLSQAQRSLLIDGRGESDLSQGVTLEVLGEGNSAAPVTDAMAKREEARQGDRKLPVTWRSLDDYFKLLERQGVSLNVATIVGATSVRIAELGESEVQPTPAQLVRMRAIVRAAMEDGAVGLGSALIYPPSTSAQTAELAELATEAGRCGGFYITHMRSEGNALLEAIDEVIAIGRRSGAPVEIYHLKAAGRANWPKLEPAIGKVEAARRSGLRMTADMYVYTAAATGLDAAMPPWVQDGGIEAWVKRMRDPAVRARLLKEMRDPSRESPLLAAGPQGTRLLSFKTAALRPLVGKTLAEAARMRGESPEDTAIDLVIEDGSRIEVAYTLMSEENVRRETALPWMSFGSDGAAVAPREPFLQTAVHPRAYGNVARLLSHYVRDQHSLTLQDAVHRLTALPAANLSLKDRGRLKAGYFADVVVFDPTTIQDHSTFDDPHQLATGVQTVLVNGGLAWGAGRATALRPGRAIRGQGWTGWKDGGCRASARDWRWRW